MINTTWTAADGFGNQLTTEATKAEALQAAQAWADANGMAAGVYRDNDDGNTQLVRPQH